MNYETAKQLRWDIFFFLKEETRTEWLAGRADNERTHETFSVTFKKAAELFCVAVSPRPRPVVKVVL